MSEPRLVTPERKVDSKGNFHGFKDSECGEHRTVGSHRAWCFEDSEWCYPRTPCRGCELPSLRAELVSRDQHIASLSHRQQGNVMSEFELADEQPEFEKAVTFAENAIGDSSYIPALTIRAVLAYPRLRELLEEAERIRFFGTMGSREQYRLYEFDALSSGHGTPRP